MRIRTVVLGAFLAAAAGLGQAGCGHVASGSGSDAGGCSRGAACDGVADGGSLGDGGSQGACSGLDVQSTCGWPEYCAGGACTPPQNATASGEDSPSSSCDFSGGNADAIRASPMGANGPVIMAMAQDLNQQDCSNPKLHTDMSPSSQGPHLCDGDGNLQCQSAETAVLFLGSVYDPASAFATVEGPALDQQLFQLVEEGAAPGAGEDLTTPADGAVHAGHLVPQGDWSPRGGSFLLLRCFGAGAASLISGSVPAHYAQTAGNPGNTFCATWEP